MYKDFVGFLFIGDPHLSSTRPGRRLDDYCLTVLEKLSQAAHICHQNRLIPVILGDLFHRNRENNIELLNLLVTVAKAFPCAPIVLEGNHDKAETALTSHDALSLMGAMGVFRLVTWKGYVDTFDFKGVPVHLWATPYGATIDESIEAKDGRNVMITHHDLAFAGAYPGAALLTEIKGCDMVVNGHMHKTSRSVVKGVTTWHNPGNISRLSVDTVDHVPSVWEWIPEKGVTLQQHALHYVQDVFDMTGLQVAAATPAELKKTFPRMMRLSQFAELLKVQDTLDASRSEDASMMVDELQSFLDEFEAPDTLRSYLSSMAKEVVAERTI